MLLFLVCCCGFAFKIILDFLRTSLEKLFYFLLKFALFCLFLCSLECVFVLFSFHVSSYVVRSLL